MGYYHDENFNQEQIKEKKRVYEQAIDLTKNAKSTVETGHNRDDSSIDSQSQGDLKNKY